MIHRLLALVLWVAVAVGAVPAAAVVLPATPATFAATIATANAGDVVQLGAGSYAALALSGRHWSPSVTVDASLATLTGVYLNNVSGLTWHGGEFVGGTKVNNAFTAANSDHVVFELASVHDYLRNAVGFGPNVDDSRVAGLTIARSGADGIDVAMSHRIVLDRNTCMDFAPTPGSHPDCIQLWSRPGFVPTADVTITNTIAVGTLLQGISLFNHVRSDATGKLVDDGGFDRIVIQNNFVAVAMPDGIDVYACRSCRYGPNVVRTLGGAPHVAHFYADAPTVAAAAGLAVPNDVGPK